LFNIVDDGDSTQEKLAKAVAEVWGVKWGFLNSTVASLVQQFAKVGPRVRECEQADWCRLISRRWSRMSMKRYVSRTFLSPSWVQNAADGQHVEAWSAMLDASKPPITSTPITPFLDEHAFKSRPSPYIITPRADGQNTQSTLMGPRPR
jgi:hypothetical protein